MAAVLPEVRKLPTGLVVDGELVAWKGQQPWFLNVCRRVLNYDLSVPVTFVAFDLLRIEGTEFADRAFSQRRDLLVSLGLDGPGWTTSETFDDGNALCAAVCEDGLEGVVAKKRSSVTAPASAAASS